MSAGYGAVRFVRSSILISEFTGNVGFEVRDAGNIGGNNDFDALGILRRGAVALWDGVPGHALLGRKAATARRYAECESVGRRASPSDAGGAFPSHYERTFAGWAQRVPKSSNPPHAAAPPTPQAVIAQPSMRRLGAIFAFA
jgi:hypothetical protein